MMDFTKKEPCFPDYSDSILNLSCSILNYYGIKTKHDTLPQADTLLARNYQHVVVILLDGLGMNILEQNLTYRDFLRRHLLMDYSSVFPPTTTASTTSMMSGLSPIEHGWLGWDMYFDQEKKTVCCFKNTLQGTETPAASYNVAEKYLPYKNIIDAVNESGKASASLVATFGENPVNDFSEWIKAIKKSIKKQGQTFTYAYWPQPDGLLHKLGEKSSDVNKEVRKINSSLAELCENSKDTLFFITADHGHANITNDFLSDYPEIVSMLERPVSMEPRAINFFVKPEFRDSFAAEFNKHFGEDYLLYTRKQALVDELFGPGEMAENLTGLGDFIAAGISGRTLLWNKDCIQFRSHHAGLRKEEMKIPLISYGRKPKKTGLVIYYSVIASVVAFILYVLFN